MYQSTDNSRFSQVRLADIANIMIRYKEVWNLPPPPSRKGGLVVSEPGPTTGMRPTVGTGLRPSHPILLPEADIDDEAVDLPAAPSAAPQPRVSVLAKLARPVAYIASGIAGAVFVVVIYGLLGSRVDSAGSRTRDDATPGVIAASNLAALDSRADSLTLVIAAFTMRSRMYDSRRMGCAGLSRGLQQVEDAWLSYNLARKETSGTTDSARDTRDRALYADVRNVELRFERSSCTRP